MNPHAEPSTKPVLLLATTNTHKAKEITEMLTPSVATSPLTYRTFHDYPKTPNLVETGTTFLENAKLKALQTADFWASEALDPNLWGILSDDSGLVVPALDGAPGVHSARYATSQPLAEAEQSKANCTKLLKALSSLTAPAARRASFFTTLVLAYKPNSATALTALEIYHVTGQIQGWIAHQARGHGGFGYDSLFVPNLEDSTPLSGAAEDHKIRSGKTFAEMSASEKNNCSHRSRALSQFKPFFQDLLSQITF